MVSLMFSFTGQKGSLQNNQAALATVTGIVDGTGSIGGALGQILIPIIQEHSSWYFVFYFFMIMVSGEFQYNKSQ